MLHLRLRAFFCLVLLVTSVAGAQLPTPELDRSFHPRADPKTGLWGFRSEASGGGRWKIQPQFAAVGQFSDGMAAVNTSDDPKFPLWGYIDYTGTIVITAQFHRAGAFEGGYAPVTKAGKKRKEKQTWHTGQGGAGGTVVYDKKNAHTVVATVRDEGPQGYINSQGKFFKTLPKKR